MNMGFGGGLTMLMRRSPAVSPAASQPRSPASSTIAQPSNGSAMAGHIQPSGLAAAPRLLPGLPDGGDEQPGELPGLLLGEAPPFAEAEGNAEVDAAVIDAGLQLPAVQVSDAADLTDVRISHYAPTSAGLRSHASS